MDLRTLHGHYINSLNTPFVWTKETDQAFDSLKQVLTQAPVLGFPIPGERYLDTDASEQGIGAVLSQMQGGVERPVAYFSRVLSRSEKQYCTTRKELLAVIKAIEYFRPYLYGVPFTLCTDHAALKWLFNFREPEGQIARWIQQLQEFDYDIQHRPGLQHSNADALSRCPCLQMSCQHCEQLEARSMEPVARCRAAVVLDSSSEEGPLCPVCFRRLAPCRYCSPVRFVLAFPTKNEHRSNFRILQLCLS